MGRTHEQTDRHFSENIIQDLSQRDMNQITLRYLNQAKGIFLEGSILTFSILLYVLSLDQNAFKGKDVEQ